jgi:hypothetical protein
MFLREDRSNIYVTYVVRKEDNSEHDKSYGGGGAF